MKIEDIRDPSFLKQMNEEECRELAEEIRSFLISSLSKTGGHIASNLGVVELTIALHKIFNAPEDKILFDVGHQSYVHKILTGRAKDFPTLRQFGGLSGFQKRKESVYDCFEAGHSSTALSSALGMAIARDLNHENYQVIAVVGDGALNTGLSLEALNEIGDEKKKLIIIFNDNNMSISRNVGALTRSFAKLRNSTSYNSLKDNVKSALRNVKNGTAIIQSIHNFKDSIKRSVVDSGIFREFDIDYIGPVDGHDIPQLLKAFEVARKKEGPCVVHCVTTKGKGYRYAEEDVTGKWHGVSRFDIASGKLLSEVPEGYASYSAIVADAVFELMKDNKDIVAITPAMITGSHLGRVFAEYPDRAFDCGIAEGHAVSFAAGLSLSRKHPFLSIYSSFLQRGYDQLSQDLCRMDLPCIIGVDRAGLVGEDGETHHGVFDIAYGRSLPNMIIAQGKDSREIQNLLYTASHTEHPFMIRYPKGNARFEKVSHFEEIPVGKWEICVNNVDEEAIIITYGEDVGKIEELISENNLPYTLVNARYLKPVDEDMLEEIFHRNKPVYVYTADILKGGLGDEILEFMNRKGIMTNITVFGIDDIFVSQGSNLQLKESLHIDIRSFLQRIEEDRRKTC